MPKLTSSLPKYRRHRASGQAIVTLYGRDFYLGPWQSKASKSEYDRLIGEWVAAGRPRFPPAQQSDITIVEVSAAYRRFARDYYRKNGEPTDTIFQVRRATELLCEKYGRTPANEFGPLSLKAFQADLIQRNLARKTVNHFVSAVRRMFRWAVSEEIVSPIVLQALIAVSGVRKGRTEARETPPVGPVADDLVDATLPYLPQVVGDLVRFQRLTGCRPGEACLVRPCDVDTSGDVWIFRPASYKTEHHGQLRNIFIGPKAQQLLLPYLEREKTGYCFVPAESEQTRNSLRREARLSPMTPSQARRKPMRNPQRSPGRCYTTDSYRRAIVRAIDKANTDRSEKGETLLPHWHPNQLRHSAGTEIRRQYGLEAAQVILGHAHADVSQVYAERDLTLAKKIMGEVG